MQRAQAERHPPALALRPLSAALGAEIIGIDLRQEIDDGLFALIRDAWHHPAQESDELLAILFEHQERREFIYEHIWRAGDLLMWDNRCTLHARTDFSPNERRLMRRVTILGEKPV